MKRIIKKIAIIFLALFSIFWTTVYGNMTAEAMLASYKFYEKHRFLIDSTGVICTMLNLAFLIFVIIIPIIIIFKKVKFKNNQDERNNYIIKALKNAELLFIINIFIEFYVNILRYGSKMTLYANIFNILISLLSIAIVLFKLLKKQKN